MTRRSLPFRPSGFGVFVEAKATRFDLSAHLGMEEWDMAWPGGSKKMAW